MSLVKPVNTSLCLEKLCEANYQQLLRLIPNLRALQQSAVSRDNVQPSLHLQILERNPYTLTIELSHCFQFEYPPLLEPAIQVRVYLDAKLAEAIGDHVREHVGKVYKNPADTVEIMEYKWRLNYFLQKWLVHCLQAGYQFA
jgi:uncharacterized protein YqiB (DUF1249 family)